MLQELRTPASISVWDCPLLTFIRDPYIIHLNIATCKWWCPFILVEKAMFQTGKVYLLRSPVLCTQNRSMMWKKTGICLLAWVEWPSMSCAFAASLTAKEAAPQEWGMFSNPGPGLSPSFVWMNINPGCCCCRRQIDPRSLLSHLCPRLSCPRFKEWSWGPIWMLKLLKGKSWNPMNPL